MKKILWTISTVIFVTTLIASPLLAAAPSPHFNPGMLIPDSVFSDTKTFGSAAAIQKFLEEKGSVLANTDVKFLIRLREPAEKETKKTLGDVGYDHPPVRTAAELIWDAAQSSGMNPQVILVTLNKEQSLITGKISESDLDRSLNHAMGFDCPDGGSCNPFLSGFYFQLFGNVDTEGNRYLGATQSLMKSFNTPGGRGPLVNGKAAQVGDTIEIGNTVGGFEGVTATQMVTIQNRSTAALYRYTPHVFNGNYNFWRFYTAWFDYPDGTLLVDTLTKTYYLISKGERRPIPAFVARQRDLNTADAVSASPTELAKYTLGKLIGPKTNTIVSIDNTLYLFIDNVKHPISSFVLKQRNLDPTKAVRISAADAMQFTNGERILPREGTILRPGGKTTIYLVKDGTLKQFSRFTLRQYGAGKEATVIPLKEFNLYTVKGYVAPKDGTLVRGMTSDAVYLIEDGKKRPVEKSLFLNLKYKRTAVSKISDAEMKDLPLGTIPTPREGTYFLTKGTNIVYQFKNAKVHQVTATVVEAKNIKPAFIFDPKVLTDWPIGDRIEN